jgi:hypothetical protein
MAMPILPQPHLGCLQRFRWFLRDAGSRKRRKKVTGGCGGGGYVPIGSPVPGWRSLLRGVWQRICHHQLACLHDVLSFDAWIEQLRQVYQRLWGIYCPDNSVTRANMAVFLVKTFNLP